MYARKGGFHMTTTTITNFRKNVFSIVQNTVRFNEPVNITTKDGNAVMISEEDYLGIMETLNLTSIPGMREKLIEGLNTPLSDTIPEEEVEWSVYKIVYTKTAVKDIPKLKTVRLDNKARALIEVLRENPYQTPPSYEKLVGDLLGLYSRRINHQHRLVYQVLEEENTVKIVSLWTHYER